MNHRSLSGQNHHGGSDIHKIKHSSDVLVVETHTSMGHRAADGPAVGGAMQAHMRTPLDLNDGFTIPATWIEQC